MSFEKIFNPKTICVIGASRDPKKIGNVIFKNLLLNNKKVFPINPNAKKILNVKAYPSVLKIKEKIDLAIIAVKAEIVPFVLEECGKKGIKHAIIISSGFKEVGNYELEEKVKKIAEKYRIKIIGPNVLGILDNYSNFDSIFIPKEKLKRPPKGFLSFVSQSGALGACLLNHFAKENIGISKFVSLGNELNVDESDLIEFLGKDKKTKVISVYIEGIKNGKKFLRIAKKVGRKKPIIVIKGGKTEEGKKAVLSHTGSLAGSYDAYKAAFKQANLIEANSLREFLIISKTFSFFQKIRKKDVFVITNGGGYGILTIDMLAKFSIPLAKLSKKSIKILRKNLPKNIVIKNPLDLLGDADLNRYKIALKACLNDKNIGILLIIILTQLPTLQNVEKLFEGIKIKKPVFVVTENKEIRKNFEKIGIPCFEFPEEAVIGINALINFNKK